MSVVTHGVGTSLDGWAVNGLGAPEEGDVDRGTEGPRLTGDVTTHRSG